MERKEPPCDDTDRCVQAMRALDTSFDKICDILGADREVINMTVLQFPAITP